MLEIKIKIIIIKTLEIKIKNNDKNYILEIKVIKRETIHMKIKIKRIMIK